MAKNDQAVDNAIGRKWYTNRNTTDVQGFNQSAVTNAASRTQEFAAVEWGGYSDVILTSGSDLNKTSDDSWWEPIDAGFKMWTAWRPNTLNDQYNVAVGANYGLLGSLVNWYFRAREFVGIGSTPGPMPYAGRPMYNNLTPIQWNLRVNDPSSQAQPGELGSARNTLAGPANYTPSGVARYMEVLQ